ncbi:mucin-2 [Neoarius graeffei]|uniref:mucin-2 n=1 Tax=Neoarius graeffei TaxID=443677 RepID=UPI00298CFBF6|nr:mucin-2 [Neoarius graeffei]XP_060800029.1 mucin-2 [Neoarius graeffei]
MKSILSTWALFLMLPWKLTGETTLRPSSTGQHEDTSKEHETTVRADEVTIFSPKNIETTLKPHGETTHNPSSTGQHEDTSKEHKTTIRADEFTIFSPKNTETTLKPHGETTHNPSSTKLFKGTSTDDETARRGDEPTSFVLKNQDEYTTEERENAFSTKPLPQTSEPQHVTSMSHAEYLTHTTTISTEESTPSSHLSSLSFAAEFPQKKTDQIAITPLTQNVPEEVITTRDDNQTLHNFKFTDKGLDRYNQGNKTTGSAEKESFKSQTVISTPFQKTSEVITKSGIEVQTIETLNTKMPSLHQEKRTHPPTLITNSNGTLGITNEESNGTATYPVNTTTGLSSTVNTKVGTTDDMEATYEITTEGIRNRKIPNPNSETTSTTKATPPKPPIKDGDKKRHPGPIVASLIGSILLLMLVAFAVAFIRSHKMKKKQMEYSDWAGPSPFIEAGSHSNLPTIKEDGSFHNLESKRISLRSFIPQQLSKRLSMLNSMNEDIPLQDTQASSTFGEHNAQPLNGKATPDQIQIHEAYNPAAEISSDSIPETGSILPATEDNENIQTPPKLDNDDSTPSSPVEINNVTPAPFEDVDLNLSPDKNTEPTSPSDAIHIPSPPPLPPS